MREIKLRGKRVDNDELVYGSLLVLPITGGVCIFSGEFTSSGAVLCHEVDPETVGQFSTLHDKNGLEIYKDDIAKLYNGNIGVVEWGEYQDEGCLDEREDFYVDSDGDERKEVGFYIRNTERGGCWGLDNMTNKWVEVIGNTWDNPDLLK